MAETELNLERIFSRLPPAVTPLAPPPELWPRIATAHIARLERRRVWRIVAGSALALVLSLALSWPLLHAPDPAAIDWQARAQALELQLDALPLPTATDSLGQLAEGELAHVDQSLQAAYDRGARINEMSPLWQRRSELLESLLELRRQQAVSTRI